MNDNKPLYERINIFLGIFASLCTITGISIWGLIALKNENTKSTNQTLESSYTIENTEEIESFSVIENSTLHSIKESGLKNNTANLPYETDNVETPSETDNVKNETLPINTTASNESPTQIQTSDSSLTVGWIQDENSNWKWILEDGDFFRNGFLSDNGNEYYFSDGIMVTGWCKIHDLWFYFDESGAMQKHKWIGRYYLSDNGTMCFNCVLTIDGITYFFNEEGIGVPQNNNIPFPTYDVQEDNANDDKILSTLFFSDDCNIEIEDGEFYLEGYVLSDYCINNITYIYYTPNLYYHTPYNGYIHDLEDKNIFYIDELDEIINSLDYDGKSKFEGDYTLTIIVEDDIGNRISKTIEWYY